MSGPVHTQNNMSGPHAARMASWLATRFNLTDSLARKIYDGLRSVWDVCGYPANISTQDYFDKYNRGGIAAKIVDFYPKITWDDSIQIRQNRESTTDSEFDKKVELLWEQFNIWDICLRADIMAGLGRDGWSVIYIGSNDNENLSLPLERGDLIYLHPHGQNTVTAGGGETGINNPRFGLPKTYTITTSDIALSNVPIHWSRIIHVVNDRLDSQYEGRPTLSPIWNNLIDLEKITGGGAEGTWRNADPWKHFNTKGDRGPGSLSSGESFNEDEIQLIRDEVDDMVHGLETSLVTHDVESKLLIGRIPAIQGNAEAIVSLIAGTLSIPKGELLGSQAGALSSSSEDTKRINKRTRERQKEKAVPLIRALIDKFMDMGVLPRVTSYDVILPPIDEKSDKDKAELIGMYASANKAYFDATGELIVTADEIRRDVLDKDPLDESEQPVRQAALSTDPPNDPDWKTVHRIADEYLDQLTSSIADIFEIAGQEISTLESAENDAMDSIESSFTELMPIELMNIINDVGMAVLELSKSRGSYFRSSRQAAQFDLEFDAENPSAVDWALTRSSTLITEISPDTRDGIRLLIAEGQARNLSRPEVVRRVKQAVGLRSDQVQSLYGFMDRLAEASPGEKVFMGIRDGERIYVTIPSTGLTRQLEIKFYNQYANQLRQYRAELISRTETLRSANQGQRELWFQASRAGELSPDVKRVWIATLDNRTRDEHASWDGAETGLNEPFDFGVEPGEEPNCRCAQGLVS